MPKRMASSDRVNMEFKTLNSIALKDILNVFNASFSDYFIPFQLSKDQLAAKMLADKVDLGLSVGVFENQKLIAFILHGADIINGNKTLYNGGTGVIPEKRGQGLTKKMYRFILPILKEKAIHTLILEVITNNIQAIKSYEKSGYKTIRRLACYKGELEKLALNNTVEVKKISEYDWNLMQSFWEIAPTWQNSINVMNGLKTSNISMGAYLQNQLVGYVIYNPSSKRLQQIAIDKKFRKNKIASTLIAELAKSYGPPLSLINVDKSYTPIHTFFEKIGLKNHLEQLEMKLKIGE